jgi:hypothetical protein
VAAMYQSNVQRRRPKFHQVNPLDCRKPCWKVRTVSAIGEISRSYSKTGSTMDVGFSFER